MGGRGSGAKPKPRELKILKGTLRPDRLKTRPRVREGMVRCPSGQPPEVQKHFRRLVRELGPSGMLRPADVDMLLQLATALAVMHEAGRRLVEDGAVYVDTAHGSRPAKSPWHQVWRDAAATVRSLSGHFGLSPADRERISAPTNRAEDENPLAAIVARARANQNGG